MRYLYSCNIHFRLKQGNRILHNVIVVKCQMWSLGFAAWLVQEVRQWPPFCLGSIVLTSDSDWFINDSKVSNGDSSSPWVTVRSTFGRLQGKNLGVGSYLLNLRQSKPSFFLQFPDGALFRGLVHIHEAARKCPATLERHVVPLNQQHLWLCFRLDYKR